MESLTTEQDELVRSIEKLIESNEKSNVDLIVIENVEQFVVLRIYVDEEIEVVQKAYQTLLGRSKNKNLKIYENVSQEVVESLLRNLCNYLMKLSDGNG